MRNRMKGQVSLDYYVALVVFIFFVVYFLFQVVNLVPNFLGLMEEQRMRSEAYQVSELLVNDVGSPANWDDELSLSNINRIGLSDENQDVTNLLSVSKINRLDSLCESEGQEFLRQKIQTDLQFSVFVIDRTDDSVRLDCLPPDTNTTTGAPLLRGFAVTMSRVVAFSDGDFGELKVQMWRPLR